jgi:dipeptidyl aminopeptidase/acylaminoacyl peptidase
MWHAAGVAVLSVGLSAAVATGAHASFPGDNGRIAYSSFAAGSKARAIHTMSASGERDRKLTRKGSARNPAWSPDGKLIAFDRGPADGEGPSRLYVMKANGHDKRLVPTEGLAARNPSWSRDGQELVFQGCPQHSDCEEDSIFVVGRRGGALREIAAEGADPVWAPNGRWIAYAGKLREGGCDTIILVRPSGRRRHAVLPDDPDENRFCPGAAGIDFSPSSRRLVYLALRARKSGSYPDPVTGEMRPLYTYDHAMYVLGRNGDGQRLVISRAIEDTEYLLPPFAWSPDGDWLLWRDDRGTFVSRPDGRGERRITGANGGGGDYAWQPLRGRG